LACGRIGFFLGLKVFHGRIRVLLRYGTAFREPPVNAERRLEAARGEWAGAAVHVAFKRRE
jgi:hypothetical protein